MRAVTVAGLVLCSHMPAHNAPQPRRSCSRGPRRRPRPKDHPPPPPRGHEGDDEMHTMKSITTITIWIACLTLMACHHEQQHHEEKGKFLVTKPLRKSTELTKDYVAQIHAIQHIELRALERGYLQEIYVDEGQHVKKGQKMFQIMPLLYQAELQKAAAEAEFTEIEYENTKILADKDVVSPNELALAKAKMDKAKAQLDLAKVHRGLTEIKAPFDGIMGRFHVRLGSLLDEGELLTTLADNSTMWAYFNVTEAEYLDYKSRTKNHEPMPVKLAMANGQVFDQPGSVETIEADFNNETGNIAFRATFPNPDGLLRHGETGKVLMSIPKDDALLIPQKATFEILDKKYVFVVGEDNKVKAQQIKIAAEVPHLYIVDSGLEEDDKILLEGLRKVKDGSEIDLDFQEPAEVLASLDLPAG
jgi:membrane fusion protein (multidrug efflux system)